MYGSMQTGCLTVGSLLDHAAQNHGDRAVISRAGAGAAHRTSYAEVHQRSLRLAAAMRALGVRAGDRVATLAWNTHRHLELFFAVPGLGAILNTVNPRLFDEQLVFILDDAGGELLFVDRSLLPLAERIVPQLRRPRTIILLDDGDVRQGCIGYESLLAAHPPLPGWTEVDEHDGAVLCYTSGTTGNPKGVLYTHRSIVLHAMAATAPAVFDVSAFAVMMPCSSMYHATGWGWPFIATMNGAALVLPGERLDPASITALIRDEGVTMTCGVPTIFTQVLRHLDETGDRLPTLGRIIIGGSAVPPALIDRFAADHGVEIRQLWGMTEISPVGSTASATPASEALHADPKQRGQGRPLYGCEVTAIGEDGAPVPRDGVTPGNLKVRGPWVVRRYYGQDADAADADGWFDTGDIATIDAAGFITLVDRAKDLIKSGGEWISSVHLENLLAEVAAVRIAAVVGIAHPKWEERPLLLIQPHEGQEAAIEKAAILDFLGTRVAKWWLPDDVVLVPEIPLTATGKIDKKRLRADWGGHYG
jgi:acyl-CoA synthetase (AMP-forming)/AMP-acid ligase II